MKYYSLIINLHPSIQSDIRVIEGEIDSEATLLEGLISLLSEHEKIAKALIHESDIRPGYLLLAEKIELKTTGKLYSPVTSNMEIRIIPISHGG